MPCHLTKISDRPTYTLVNFFPKNIVHGSLLAAGVSSVSSKVVLDFWAVRADRLESRTRQHATGNDAGES